VFQGVAEPYVQSWTSGFSVGHYHLERTDGAEIALDILEAIQSMRHARVSCFRFSNPRCTGCAGILGEHERLLMQSFRAVRRGKTGEARTHAMLLCEGNDTDEFLYRLAILARSTQPLDVKQTQLVS